MIVGSVEDLVSGRASVTDVYRLDGIKHKFEPDTRWSSHLPSDIPPVGSSQVREFLVPAGA